MKFQEIKELVEYYEDRIIINFEKYFSQLVLMDFYEGGYNDRTEDEFYYEEYFSDYESEIVNLLLRIEDEFDDNYQDFKIRLIKLKRVIDTKLSKATPHLDVDYLLKRNKRNNQFLINIGIEKEKFIQILHNQLHINKLIYTEYQEFKAHFNDNWGNKIQWQGTEIQITNLFCSLIDEKYLDPETHNFKYKLISKHFLNKSGKSFIEKQLGTVYAEKRNTIPKDDVILKIIEEMSIIFN